MRWDRTPSSKVRQAKWCLIVKVTHVNAYEVANKYVKASKVKAEGNKLTAFQNEIGELKQLLKGSLLCCLLQILFNKSYLGRLAAKVAVRRNDEKYNADGVVWDFLNQRKFFASRWTKFFFWC